MWRELWIDWRDIWADIGPFSRAVFLLLTPVYVLAYLIEAAFVG